MTFSTVTFSERGEKYRHRRTTEVVIIMILTVVYNNLQKLKIDVIYLRYRKLLYVKAYEILEDAGLSEDAVAETISVIVKHKNKMENKDEIHMRNYMVRVCRNIALKMKKNPEISFENMDELYDYNASYVNPEDIVIDKEGYLRLKDALDKMKPEYKDLIMFRYTDNMSAKEISELTGLKVDTVRKRLQRAKNMMSEILKKEGLSNE